MSNALNPELLSQIFAQESFDPFLTLVTLSHPDWDEPIYLVNNSVDFTSRGQVFTAFPMRIRLPVDDGETARSFNLELDNASLYLIAQVRSVTEAIKVKIEMVLASFPDDVQMEQDELSIQSVTYNKAKITANIVLDNFLNTELSSERYTPSIFPGLF